MTRTADQLACGSQQVASELNCSHQDDANQGRGARGGKGKKATCARAHPTRRRFGGGWRRLTSRQSCAPRQGGRPGAACRRAARGRNEQVRRRRRRRTCRTPARTAFSSTLASTQMLRCAVPYGYETRRAAPGREIFEGPRPGVDGIGFHVHW